MHGNNLENNEIHHLYVIKDKLDNDVVKYGISAEPIGEDGLSTRVRRQLRVYNALVGWLRFFGEILVKEIEGRKAAEIMEQKFIADYEKENGQKPRANLK